MDISIPVSGTKLNIRVTVLLKTKNGFIFEQDKSGFFFPVGGRIKINESSIDAAKREVKEELGVDIAKLEYQGTIENFFRYDNTPFHEINIVHKATIKDFECPDGFYVFDQDSMKDLDVKPVAIKDMVSEKGTEIRHLIVRDN